MTRVSTAVLQSRATNFKPKAFALGTLAAVVAGFLIAFVIESTGLPGRIETLTVENLTDFPLDVELSGAGESWLGVGVVDAGTTKDFTGVIDQGTTWVFRFSSQGATSARKVFSREELTESDWRLVVPRSVADELRATGVEPPP